MPSTKPRINGWIPERVRAFFNNRMTRPIYVEPSAAPTPRLRKDDEAARLASALLKHKALVHKVEKLPEEAKAYILANGGDVLKLQDQLAELRDLVAHSIPMPVLMAPDHSAWLQTGQPLAPAHVDQIRVKMLQWQEGNRAQLAELEPVALAAEVTSEFTFLGLFKHWRGGSDDDPSTWRVRQPRHYWSTARQLEQCFPKRDYRSITVEDAIHFADWMHEKGVGPAAQGNHISNARSMYAKAWKFMLNKPNPFEKVEPVAQHQEQNGGKFTYEQLRAILRVMATPDPSGYRWGDNRIEKRHKAALWLIKLAMYTGARISELAALRKDDVREYRGLDGKGEVQFYWINFRKEIVKAQKGEDKSRDTPLHPDIADAFVKHVDGVKGPLIFGCFGGKAQWVVSNFPSFLRDNAEALGITLRNGKPVDHKGRPLKQHSLRHTLHKAMNDSRINADAQRILVGRKGADVHESVYGTDMALEELHKDVCQLKPLGPLALEG